MFIEAKRLTGHTEFVVVGSMSIDVDCYTKEDLGQIFELEEELGEGSSFESRRWPALRPDH